MSSIAPIPDHDALDSMLIITSRSFRSFAEKWLVFEFFLWRQRVAELLERTPSASFFSRACKVQQYSRISCRLGQGSGLLVVVVRSHYLVEMHCTLVEIVLTKPQECWDFGGKESPNFRSFAPIFRSLVRIIGHSSTQDHRNRRLWDSSSCATPPPVY